MKRTLFFISILLTLSFIFHISRASTDTIGYSTIGASIQDAGSGSGSPNPVGLLVTFPVSAKVTKLTAYVRMTSTTRGDGPGTSFAQINYDTGGAANTGYVVNDLGTPVYNTQKASIYATYTASSGSFFNGMMISSAF